MIEATLDTNVIVSGLASAGRAGSPTGEVIRAWNNGRFVFVTSAFVLDEVRTVLVDEAYFRERITEDQRARFAAAVARHAKIVHFDDPIADIAPHHHDDALLTTAVIGQANCVVTGDRELLAMRRVRSVDILSPREFLLRLG